MWRNVRNLSLTLLLGSGICGPAVAQGETLLGQIPTGAWELRFLDGETGKRRICIRDAADMVQLRHRSQSCRRVTLDSSASEITVQYTCPGNGYGRTHIRRETNRLLQINAQGIEDGLPFAFAAEARRIGACN